MLDGLIREALTSNKTTTDWSKPQHVQIDGYDKAGDHKMEVGVSTDGTTLFFNNSNEKPMRTDVFYATRVKNNDTHFTFRGPIQGVNMPNTLDATPAIHDQNSVLSFVSTRGEKPHVYWGKYNNGRVTEATPLPINISSPNFILGMETNGDLDTIFFTYRSLKDRDYMDISMATWQDDTYIVPSNWDKILQNVNTSDMEYAPEITTDLLELWFTRLAADKKSAHVIHRATRNNIHEPFSKSTPHPTIFGPAEAPTLTGDNNTMYYHCRKTQKDTWEVCVTHRLKNPKPLNAMITPPLQSCSALINKKGR
jgi:hypothetical protein